MVVDFPIRIDIDNVLVGAMWASLPHRAAFAAEVVDRFAAQVGLDPADPLAGSRLQERYYHGTVDHLRKVRRVLGHPGKEDLYSLPWFLLSFHGWTAIAELHGIGKIGWTRSNADIATMHRCLFELGVACTEDELRARLLALADTNQPPTNLKSVDVENYAFTEQASYLSSAAVRTGHRVGLHVPAKSVFISYARKNRAFLDRLVTFLESHAVRVWYDTSDLKSGTRLDDRLRQEIGSVDCLVVVLTDESLRSAYVALEVAAALDMGKELLPVSLVPLEKLGAFLGPDGRDLHPAIMEHPVVDASGLSPIQAYEDVLRSLQRVGRDLTRWKQDEGSHISLLRDVLARS